MSATIARMYGGEGYARIAHDAYQTPAWVTELLLKHVAFESVVWEPAAGEGFMARPLKAAGLDVFTGDIRKCGTNDDRVDFLGLWNARDMTEVRAIITNPPFSHAEGFIRRALEITAVTGGKVAMLLPYEYDTALKARGDLFKDRPFACKIVLGRRIRWVGFEDKASPRQNHAWYVWDWHRAESPRIIYA